MFAAAAFLATRAALLFGYTPTTTDTRIYFRWLSQAAAGRVALVDFPVEYPPFAWWVIHVPGGAERLAYQFRFRALMTVADVASFALLAWIVSRRRASLLTVFACLYIAAPLVLAHEMYDRLAELVHQHRTTLIFVNQRRVAESGFDAGFAHIAHAAVHLDAGLPGMGAGEVQFPRRVGIALFDRPASHA